MKKKSVLNATALEGLIKINSLFSIAIFISIIFLFSGLENPSSCKANETNNAWVFQVTGIVLLRMYKIKSNQSLKKKNAFCMCEMNFHLCFQVSFIAGVLEIFNFKNIRDIEILTSKVMLYYKFSISFSQILTSLCSSRDQWKVSS